MDTTKEEISNVENDDLLVTLRNFEGISYIQVHIPFDVKGFCDYILDYCENKQKWSMHDKQKIALAFEDVGMDM